MMIYMAYFNGPPCRLKHKNLLNMMPNPQILSLNFDSVKERGKRKKEILNNFEKGAGNL